MIQISQETIKIENKKYVVINMRKNIKIADSFAFNTIGSGNGDKGIYFGQDEIEYCEFFDWSDESTISCFFLKEDLEKFMDDAEEEYNAPQQEYGLKEDMPSLFQEYNDELNDFDFNLMNFEANRIEYMGTQDNDKPLKFRKFRKFYIGSESEFFEFVRKISLSKKTFCSIFKLKDCECNIRYYFKITFGKYDSNFNFKYNYENFSDFLLKHNYYFKKELIENFLLSLKVKPFIIFIGNSGTGKTKLAQLYAKYLSLNLDWDCEFNRVFKDLDINIDQNFFELSEMESNNYQLVSVGANWVDNRNIFGFYNILKDEFNYTPAHILIYTSNIVKTHPFFLILDEMNLSHVERYFSDFLSSMESGTRISLYGSYKKLEIPKNLKVIGTVNMDETTYMFSPKVLDRANVIAVETTDVKKYMSNFHDNMDFKGDISFLESPFSKVRCYYCVNEGNNEKWYTKSYDIPQMNIQELKEYIDFRNDELWGKLSDELNGFQEILKNSGFDFGFRTINEILRFMVAALEYEKDNVGTFEWERYFDAQIMQKVLPKLHGSQNVLGDTLEELLRLCIKDKKLPEDFSDKNDIVYKFKCSALKLEKMRNNLNKKHYVSFMD